MQEIMAYDRRVFDRFERALLRRPWSDLTRSRGIGHETLKDTLVHILNVQEAWCVAIPFARWDRLSAPGRRPAEIGSKAAYRAYRDRVWAGVDALREGLTERLLARRVKAPWMPGQYTLRDGLLQATVEEAHHLGEIIGALWQDDTATPPMTWIENRVRVGRARSGAGRVSRRPRGRRRGPRRPRRGSRS